MVNRYAPYQGISFEVCVYCNERPVFEHFQTACFDCSFVCEFCEELTGYDAGMAGDDLCDDCAVSLQDAIGITNKEGN